MHQLTMVHLDPGSAAAPVAPAGFVLRTYQPGDEEHWAAIVNTTDMGRDYDRSLTRQFLTAQPLFDPEGFFLACDAATGEPLATACAWWSTKFGRRVATLHMVAAKPAALGRGLGKLVSLAVLHYFGQRGAGQVFLTTDDHRVPAIAVYLKLGWRPVRYVRGEDHASRWQAVFEKYEGRCGPLRYAGPGRPVKIAVLGLRRGLHLCEWIAQHPAGEILAGADRMAERRAGFAAKYPQAKAADSFEALLASKAEAVLVANDCPEHAPAAIAALAAGRHVFSEVTACHTPAEAVELIEAAEAAQAAGVSYTLGENCLYSHAALELAHQSGAGALGELQYAEGDYVHDCTYLATRAGQPYWRTWYPPLFYCTHSLGPILRAASLAVGAGSPRPVRVVGMHTGNRLGGPGHGPDGGAMLIQTEGGAAIRVAVALAVRREPASLWLCYYGTQGSLETDRWDERVHLWQRAAHTTGPVSYRPTGREARGRDYTLAGHGGADPRLMEYWLESLANGLRPPVDVYEGVAMTLPGILGHRSSLEGSRPIDLPDLRDAAQRDPWRADRRRPDPDNPMQMIAS